MATRTQFLASVRDECVKCGAWSAFTGRTDVADGQRLAVLHCAQCNEDYRVWSPEWEILFDRFEPPLLPGDAPAGQSGIRRARVLRLLAERLCRFGEGSEDALRSWLGWPEMPAPLGGRDWRVDFGRASLATLEIRQPDPAMELRLIEGALGAPVVLPRAGPHASYLLGWDVSCAGEPATTAVLARFASTPRPDSAPASMLLRLDRL